MEKDEGKQKGFLRKVKRNRISIARHLVQVVSFCFIFGGIFGIAATHIILPIVAPFGNPYTTVGGAWAFLEIVITSGAFPALAIAVIALSSLLLGRTFCGWVCPLGLIYEIEGALGKEVHVSKNTNRAFYKLSLLLACIFLFFSVSIGYREAVGKSIYDMFGKMAREPSSILDPLSTIASMLFWFFWLEKYPTSLADLADYSMLFWLRLTFLAIFFIVGYYVIRGYCRYLCPLGGVVGYASQYSVLSVYRDNRICQDGCRECERACPMGIAIRDFDGRIGSPLCIYCGACIEKCEVGGMSLDLR